MVRYCTYSETSEVSTSINYSWIEREGQIDDLNQSHVPLFLPIIVHSRQHLFT